MSLPVQRLAFLGLSAVFSCLSPGAEAQQAGAEVRPALVRAADARQPIGLQRLEVAAEVVGTLARTRVELVLHNPNDRVLEGELQFPLLEGQTVSGFGLDIGGRMRAAVPVDKAKGQQVFEEIVRGNVDPALLEKTVGNNFKLRVYPLPARGERRVALLITENLSAGKDGRLTYRLPRGFGEPSGESRFSLRLAGIAPDQVKPGAALAGAEVSQAGADALVEAQRKASRGAAAQPLAEVSWSAAKVENVSADRFEEADYFYAEVPVNYPTAQRLPPRSITIVWDASGSGAGRDHNREFALLNAYFKHVPNIAVNLVLARDKAEAPQEFSVRNGNWDRLRTALESVAYDGASNPAAWTVRNGLARNGSLALLFSDGLANWGEEPVPVSPVPLFAVNAALAADPDRLRSLAERSGGRYLDLMRQSPAFAAAEIAVRRARLLSLQGEGVSQLVSASAYPEGGFLRIAGKVGREGGNVTLTLENPWGERVEQQLAVKPLPRPARRIDLEGDGPAPAFPGLAAQRWASLRIAALEAERHLNRGEIRRLGQRFGLVTGETSLIVLENLADYLRHEILPPAGDLRQEYESRLGQRNAERRQSRSAQLDSVARRFEERIKWWETDFPKGDPAKAREREPERAPSPSQPAMAPRHSEAVSAPAPAAKVMLDEGRRPAAPASAPAPGKPTAVQEAATASIQLQKWQPDAPYARRLREARDEDRYAIYLDERPAYLSSTAFFLDAAEIFFDRGQPDLALRVLSNLAEMNLENRHILRILAYRLQQAGQVKLALPLLKRVRDLAPEEPQSWRDLGLAQAAAGDGQAAIEALWEVVAMPVLGRFADIDVIALAELNAILARFPGLDTSAMDKRLLRNLPLDLRAVLTWDADNSDMDLWVTDPNGEAAYFGHKLTYQGGRMSRDFTGGYGPEEFALRLAKPGRYEVRAKFYGHRQQVISPYTTLMLRLTTGFGTAAEQSQEVTLRLSGSGEEVRVGSFEIGGKP